LRILDATAGWGRDAAILASFGAEVVMVEKNPVMAALLQDGLKRLSKYSPLANLLSLHFGDAKEYLQNLVQKDYPDVIYIDPMHPVRQKKALVKKDMQALQQLIEQDEDLLDLLDIARLRTCEQVVVKWPQRTEPLLPPSFSFDGKTVRFDVYTHFS
jgi:16S rRNA (guanine1516-N2)-methyltransferase